MATFTYYAPQVLNQYNGGTVVDWDTDIASGTLRMGLYTASYTPNNDTHYVLSDVGTANEVTGTNYTANGQQLAGRSVTIDTTNNRVGLVCNDVTWGTATISGIRYAVIYRWSGTAPTSPLMAYADLGAQSVTGANFTVDITNGTVAYFSYT